MCDHWQEQLRRENERKEKKQKEYESLSYEQQQKLDELNLKKQQRKRVGRKVRYRVLEGLVIRCSGGNCRLTPTRRDCCLSVATHPHRSRTDV